MTGKQWLQHNQVLVYAVAVAAAVTTALVAPATSSMLERSINPILAVLLYVTFLEIPFVRIRRAARNLRFMTAALGMNFLAVPVIVFALTRALPQEPVLLVGVFLVLLTPCIDYVITFTELAGGDADQLTAATPALMLVQLLLLPAYLWLFMGRRVATFIEPGPFIEAFVAIIAAPLGLAWVTEYAAERSSRVDRWQTAMGWLPVPMMGLTLFAVIASQLPRVRDSLDQIAVVVPVYVAFLFVMPLLARIAAGLLGMDVGESRALVFTSVTRNSLVVLPLALALPPAFALAPAVVVTQTLVELSGMVVLTRVVPSHLVPDSADQPLGVGSVQDE
ncbi:MAG: ACR3 family arsenite transporter [Natronomonas sp.]